MLDGSKTSPSPGVLDQPAQVSPWRLLLAVAGAVFFAEALVMCLLPVLPPLSPLGVTLLDATLLTVVVSPVLYLYLLRPMMRHIAERRHAEAALFLERDRLRNILDLMQDGVYIVDQHYRIEYINPVLKRQFGPVDGRACYTYFHDRESACPWCPNAQVFAGQLVRWEWTSAKTGKLYDLFDVPLHQADGRVSKLEILHDISARRRAELDLRASEEQFRQLAENIREVFWITSPDYAHFLYVSPAYEEIWGRARAELFEAPGLFLETVLPEDRPRIAAVLQSGAEFDEEHRIRRPDGSVRWIRSRGFLVCDANGQVYRVAGISEDVTERVQAVQLLEQRVQERTIKLYEQAQHLAALEERQRLARDLHDSLSQTLYGITLGVQAAHKGLEGKPAKVIEALDYVSALADAGLTEMRALIFDLRPESLETEGLVNALARKAAALRARSSLMVQVSLGAEPAVAPAMKEAFYRIAQEAMHNAAKHARAEQLTLSFGPDGDGLALEISDDGRGFDPNGSFPGHLGLRSMRERAARLGGSLEIRSTPGRGTLLRAWLPCSPVQPPQTEAVVVN